MVWDFFSQWFQAFQLFHHLFNWGPSLHNTGLTLVWWGDTWKTWQTKKPGHTPLLSRLSLLQISPGTYLQVQVAGRHGNSWEWGLFALFLLSSLKPCHYPYSTGTRVCKYASVCMIVSLFVRPPARLYASIRYLLSPLSVHFDPGTIPPSPIHFLHLLLYWVHSWSPACICAHFVLHPTPY